MNKSIDNLIDSFKSISISELPKFLEKNSQAAQLSLAVKGYEDLCLSWFEKLPDLNTLKLGAPEQGHFHFRQDASREFTQLTSLTLEQFYVRPQLLESIASLRLQHLTLKNPICGENGAAMLLSALSTCTHLQSLHFEMAASGAERGVLHLLRKRLPQTKVTPEVILTEHSDYETIFSTEPRGPFCYSVSDIKNKDYEHKFTELLQIEKEAERSWPCVEHNVYEHNSSTFRYASPIRFLDERVRFAISEPVNRDEITAFWDDFIKHKGSVIVMVKDPWSTSYYPKQETKTFHFTEKTTTVSCDKVTYCEKKDSTLTALTVNDRAVSHLQIMWEGFMGIDVDKLYGFIQQVDEIEQKNPGATVVHCYAGVGRTGTFIACYLLFQFAKKISLAEQQYFDLGRLLAILRYQRPELIETEVQLHTVIQFLRKLLLL